MDALELRRLLAKPEWTDVEIKKSARAFPKDAASTICAFANSGGGYLILGVDEKQLPEISGIDADKFDEVQNQCLDWLKGKQRFSSSIEFDPPSIVDIDGALVLVVRIQESKRQNKPVKLIKDKQGKVYLRKGSRDEEATDVEITRMQMDANSSGVTAQLLELDVETCFDPNTLKWYRKVYESLHNGKHYELSDVEFLDELGLIREDGDDLKPTKAAVLMFGTEKEMSHQLARKVVDAIWYQCNLDDHNDDTDWKDRRPLPDSTPNLFDAWRILSERFMYFSEQNFDIDEHSMQRKPPPDYIGFREAAVNLLVHQDFSDHHRVPKIKFFKDVSVYWNPGDSMVEDNLIAKGESASRNPLIIQTFHRIDLSERAGSGIGRILKYWRELDRPVPEIKNDKARKTFQITLGKRPQVTKLSDESDQPPVKVTNLETEKPQNSDQPTELVTKLNKKQCRLLLGMDGEMTRQQLMDLVGQTHRTNFKNNQLQPVIDLNLVAEKYPDNKNHPEQAYFLTGLGQVVKNLIDES